MVSHRFTFDDALLDDGPDLLGRYPVIPSADAAEEIHVASLMRLHAIADQLGVTPAEALESALDMLDEFAACDVNAEARVSVAS